MTATRATFLSESTETTERLGAALAAYLPRGTVVALQGDLASGKTCLVRGMAAHFGDAEEVHSPTFTLINEYGTDPKLYHMDLYRLGGPEEVADLGCEEIFDSDHVCAVEWAERAEGLLPKRRLDVHFAHAGGDRRRIEFSDRGVMSAGWSEALAAACPLLDP